MTYLTYLLSLELIYVNKSTPFLKKMPIKYCSFGIFGVPLHQFSWYEFKVSRKIGCRDDNLLFFLPRFSHVRNDDNDTFVHRSNNPDNDCKTQFKALSYSYDIHLLFVEWSVCLYHQGQIANGHYMCNLGSLSYIHPSIYL